MRDPKPLLVGEDNPHGSDPRFALYPLPPNCAGHRLCEKILGLYADEYLRGYDRMNLCSGKWSARTARERAERLLAENPTPRIFILLGAKVAGAFRLEHEPFTMQLEKNHLLVQLPHPSGRCRVWNTPGAYKRARHVLLEAGLLAAAHEPGAV